MKSQKYRVIKEYQSPYLDHILFRKGEQIIVGREFKDDPDWQNWRWCEGKDKKAAWAPVQYLTIKGTNGIFKQDYNAQELTVHKGEIVEVDEVVNGFGMAKNREGIKGWVPMRNLEISNASSSE